MRLLHCKIPCRFTFPVMLPAHGVVDSYVNIT